MAKEVTQASKMEFKSWVDAGKPGPELFNGNKVELFTLFDNMKPEEIAKLGGLDNIQRLRLVHGTDGFKIDFNLIKNPAILDKERKEALEKEAIEKKKAIAKQIREQKEKNWRKQLQNKEQEGKLQKAAATPKDKAFELAQKQRRDQGQAAGFKKIYGGKPQNKETSK